MKMIVRALLFCFSVVSSSSVFSQDMSVSLVAYKDCHPDVGGLEFSMRPQLCSMSEQALSFMIKGNNIALVVKDSLDFSKLEVGGKDVRFNRKGDRAFEMGSFPQVDGNGEFAIFDVVIKSAPFGYVGSASVIGSVDVITSERLMREEKDGLDITKEFSLEVGPIKVSNFSQSEVQPQGAIGEMGEVLKKGIRTSFLGDAKNELAIFLSGKLDAFVELEVYENGNKLKSSWSVQQGGEKTLFFSKPSGSKMDIKLKYWDGLNRVTVPINL